MTVVLGPFSDASNVEQSTSMITRSRSRAVRVTSGRVLTVPLDIVEAIFGHLALSGSYAVTLAALARCARTCRAYHHIAAALLWRESSLHTICGVLPGFASSKVKKRYEEGDSDSDWSEDGSDSSFYVSTEGRSLRL